MESIFVAMVTNCWEDVTTYYSIFQSSFTYFCC